MNVKTRRPGPQGSTFWGDHPKAEGLPAAATPHTGGHPPARAGHQQFAVTEKRRG